MLPVQRFYRKTGRRLIRTIKTHPQLNRTQTHTAVKQQHCHSAVCCISLNTQRITHVTPLSTRGGHCCLLREEMADGKSSLRAHLDCLGRLQRLLRRDAHLSLPQQLLGEVGDVSSCDGDVLYTAADDVTLSLRDTQEDVQTHRLPHDSITEK